MFPPLLAILPLPARPSLPYNCHAGEAWRRFLMAIQALAETTFCATEFKQFRFHFCPFLAVDRNRPVLRGTSCGQDQSRTVKALA
jgi:hypothetical protein